MKKVLFPLVVLLLVACRSGKDEQFCKCLKASEALNTYSNAVLSGEIDQAKADTLKSLRKKKSEACSNYSTMSGEETMKLKKECAE